MASLSRRLLILEACCQTCHVAQPSLDEAAERLYDAFGDVPRPQRVEGCPHCVRPDEDLPLVSRPLREISPQDLSRYAFKAMSTWGTEADFRYFAPRVLDLTASGAMAWPGFEIVCGKLDQAGLRTWAQRPAVEEFLRAFWTATLHRFPSSPPVSEVMEGVATVAYDISPYLAEWERLDTAACVRHLREAAETELGSLRPGWRLAAAEAVTGSAGRLRQWLTAGAAADAVIARALQTDDEELLDQLTQAHDALSHLGWTR
jgi:hypothetical protein